MGPYPTNVYCNLKIRKAPFNYLGGLVRSIQFGGKPSNPCAAKEGLCRSESLRANEGKSDNRGAKHHNLYK